MHASIQAVPDGADVWSEIPDIGPLDRSGDNEQRWLQTRSAVIAQPPIMSAGKGAMRQFGGIESDSAEDVSLRAAQKIKSLKLSLS